MPTYHAERTTEKKLMVEQKPLDIPPEVWYNEITKKQKGDKEMEITVNKDKLVIMLEMLIDNIGCGECPLYEKCKGCSCSRSCAEFFIEYLNN